MIREWLRIAVRADVVARSLRFGIIVGVILIAINHGNAIVAGEVDSTRIVQMILTPIVPYCVATASSCGAILDGLREPEQC